MARKEKSYIDRIDGKNCFFEVVPDAFSIGKVRINFREYDEKRPAGDKFTKEIDIYMDIKKFLRLERDIMSGRIASLASAEKEKNADYPNPVFTYMGGSSPESLKNMDEYRVKNNKKSYSEMYNIPQGKAISKQFKITPGKKYPFMIVGECGEGEVSDTGLIVPKYGTKPAQRVMVPISIDDLKEMALIVSENISGFITASYMKEKEQKTNK